MTGIGSAVSVVPRCALAALIAMTAFDATPMGPGTNDVIGATACATLVIFRNALRSDVTASEHA